MCDMDKMLLIVITHYIINGIYHCQSGTILSCSLVRLEQEFGNSYVQHDYWRVITISVDC